LYHPLQPFQAAVQYFVVLKIALRQFGPYRGLEVFHQYMLLNEQDYSVDSLALRRFCFALTGSQTSVAYASCAPRLSAFPSPAEGGGVSPIPIERAVLLYVVEAHDAFLKVDFGFVLVEERYYIVFESQNMPVKDLNPKKKKYYRDTTLARLDLDQFHE
jgi:hypothetical protein